MKVAVIAFGTRGDVQPVAVLAAGIASSSPWCSEVLFLTHQLHEGFVEKMLLGGAECCEGRTMPQLATVDSPPVLWKGSSGSEAAEARANLAQQDGCMEACRGAGLVIFNMFALEGFHVSEAYNIPCVVCHPYLTTATPMPSSFPARMRRAYPRLFRRLTRLSESLLSEEAAHGGGSAVTGATESSSSREGATGSLEGRRGRAETAWAHVEHWMWPLFTDRWGAFRERLGLHPCPFLKEEQTAGPVERRSGSGEEGLGLSVPDMCNRAARGVLGGVVDPARLPPVLYLFSPLVVDASPFWPDCVRVCGYLFPTRTPTAIPALAPGTTTTQPKGGGGGGLEPAHSLGSKKQRHRTADQQPAADQWQRHQLDPNLARASSEQTENHHHHHHDTTGTHVHGTPRAACAAAKKGENIVHGLPADVEAFLSAREDRPVYLGFGSMWTMCLPGYRLAFALRALLRGARQAGSRCVVHLPGPPTSTPESMLVGGKGGFGGAEAEAEAGSCGNRRMAELDSAVEWVSGEFALSASSPFELLVFQGPVGHDLLLPRCSVAIHHGGSGTTAAVLRAGIPQVVCPQQLDQFFWAERVKHLAVGSVLERSLFVEREPAPIEPPGPLVCQAAAAILSALTPQTKLRAACLGVKVRAENGLENALDSLSHFARERKRSPQTSPTTTRTTAGETTQQPNTVASEAVTALPCATPTAASAAGLGHACTESACGGGTAPAGRVSYAGGMSPRQGGGGGGGGGGNGEDGLVLREMPNGLRVWWGSRAEEEALFVFGEVFEDRTYARMGVSVQDGDTVWDVGANVGLASIFFELQTDTPDSVHVFAFEPLPLNSTALKRNLSMHCPTAVVQEYALGAKHQDRVPATFYPRMPGNSTLRPLEKERLQGGRKTVAGESAKRTFFDDAEQVTCDVRTVSWAMATLGVDKIDLLKIDVEGAELDVLLGVDEQDWPKIRQVVAEVHPVGDRVARACELLRDHEFDVSTQALGLDGTPISPSRCTRTATDAPANGTTTSEEREAALPLPPDAARTMTADRLNAATKDAESADQDDRKRACDSRAGSSPASTTGDEHDRDVGEGRSLGCRLNDAALDGVVVMVYAKRLPA